MKVKTSRNSGGFTIVELLVVIVIIAILASLAIPNYIGMRNRAASNTDGSSAKVLRDAEAQMYVERGYFCESSGSVSPATAATAPEELPVDGNFVLATEHRKYIHDTSLTYASKTDVTKGITREVCQNPANGELVATLYWFYNGMNKFEPDNPDLKQQMPAPFDQFQRAHANGYGDPGVLTPGQTFNGVTYQ